MTSRAFNPNRDELGRFADKSRPDPLDITLDIAPTVSDLALRHEDWVTASAEDFQAAVDNPTVCVFNPATSELIECASQADAERLAATIPNAYISNVVSLAAAQREQGCICNVKPGEQHDTKCLYRNGRIRADHAAQTADTLRSLDGDIRDDAVGDKEFRARTVEAQLPGSAIDVLRKYDERISRGPKGDQLFRRAALRMADREAEIARRGRGKVRPSRPAAAAGGLVEIDGASTCSPCADGDHDRCSRSGCMCTDMDHDSDT